MLAAAPITWGVCELPDWGEVPPYGQVLDEMAAAGFRGTELGPPGFLPEHPEALRRELSMRGMELVGAFCPLTFRPRDETAGSVGLALTLARRLADAGCPLLIAADAGDERRRAIAGSVPAGDGFDRDDWRHAGETLAGLAAACVPLGMRVAFHPHAGTYVETGAEVDALMAAVRDTAVGLCLDTGHLAYGGADPVAVARAYGDRIWHVHAKDVRAERLAAVRPDGTDYATAVGLGVFAPLGDGAVDFPSLIAALGRAGYQGWYVLEQDVRLGPPWPSQDPAHNARRSAAYLSRLLRDGSAAAGGT
jgi:inosose dehydratase